MNLTPILTISLCLVSSAASAVDCSQKPPSTVFHILTNGCDLDKATSLKVRIGKKDSGIKKTLTKAQDAAFFEGSVPPEHPIDSDTEIAIDTGVSLGTCCWHAQQLPVSATSRDCYVEYTVSCDKRDWGFSVNSDAALASGFAFQYQREHPDFEGIACSRTGDLDGSSASGFGVNDHVRLQIRWKGATVFNYQIPVAQLLQNATLPIDDTGKFAVALKKDILASIGDTKSGLDLIKQKLPKKITLAKQ